MMGQGFLCDGCGKGQVLQKSSDTDPWPTGWIRIQLAHDRTRVLEGKDFCGERCAIAALSARVDERATRMVMASGLESEEICR